jgi:MoaA/NifB/PqqE/SkfB family radical SAM enzyme
MSKGKEIEIFSQQNQRVPKMLFINIVEKCNQDCVFCFIKGKGKAKYGSMSKDKVKETIKKFMDSGGRDIVFTGGEPTLRDDLPEMIEYAEKFNTLNSISINSNGIRLSDEKYFNMLIDADKKKKIDFSISLHSHKETISELLTNAKGTFKKTISGIENIIKKGQRLSIYHVITSKNYKDLLEFAKFLNKKYPEIKNITLAYPLPEGNALLNDWIYVKLSSLKPYLIKTLKFLEKKNYTVIISACGQVPLCVIPGFEEKLLNPLFWNEENVSGVVGTTFFNKFNMASREWIDQLKNKSKECEKCILNKYCQGLWKKYIDLFGFDGIQPIREDNFTGNKIKLSLENDKQVQETTNKIKKDKVNLIILMDFIDDCLNKLIDFLKNNKIFAVIIYKDSILYPK